MKTTLLTLTIVLFWISSFAHNQTNPSSSIQQKNENAIYQLFPTQNYWTFIKLDTRNGKMWQVHFTVTDDGERAELVLNSIPLVVEGKEIIGRFTLYPTENMYNFLLLDQIDGYVYQVQWSMTKDYRGVIPIF